MKLIVNMAFCAAGAALFPALLAEPQEPVAITVDVDVVQILATVRDKRGGLVSTLEKDEFQVSEGGKRQEIRYFTRETDAPLTLGLLVDVSGSQISLLDAEQTAANEFFGQVIGPRDLAFVIRFGEDTELLPNLIRSPEQLDTRFNGLPQGIFSVSQPGPSQTVLYDAVYAAANVKIRGEAERKSRGEGGRKAIVIISDGVEGGSRVSIDQAIEAAQKANAVIYGIEYYDRGFYQRNGLVLVPDSRLGKLAEQTGGRVFRVNQQHPLDEVFKALQNELRSQYSIGFTPNNTAKDGRFRKLEIKTTRKDVKVQARKGYYAPGPDR